MKHADLTPAAAGAHNPDPGPDRDAPEPDTPRTGTQAIERVVGMLRVVASRGRRGMRIAEVVSTSGLPTSTCFRMLQRLEVEGLVIRDAVTRKYHLGPLLHELGLLAEPSYRLSDLCDPAMAAVADRTQDTVYLSERRGLEAVCTNRALGDFPIKALTLDIGIRRPLGVGAGGLAILSALPAAEAEAIIDANSHRYARFASFDVGFLRAEVLAARERGYAFLDSAVTPGTAALGVAIPGMQGDRPIAAFSVAAISSRMAGTRRDEIAQAVQQQVRQVGALLAAQAVRPPR